MWPVLRNTMTFNVYIHVDGVRLKTCAEPASQGSKVTLRASAIRIRYIRYGSVYMHVYVFH